eukprot:168987-Rhodomonas_salina.1
MHRMSTRSVAQADRKQTLLFSFPFFVGPEPLSLKTGRRLNASENHPGACADPWCNETLCYFRDSAAVVH